MADLKYSKSDLEDDRFRVANYTQAQLDNIDESKEGEIFWDTTNNDLATSDGTTINLVGLEGSSQSVLIRFQGPWADPVEVVVTYSLINEFVRITIPSLVNPATSVSTITNVGDPLPEAIRPTTAQNYIPMTVDNTTYQPGGLEVGAGGFITIGSDTLPVTPFSGIGSAGSLFTSFVYKLG